MSDLGEGYALSEEAVRALRRNLSDLRSRSALRRREGRTAQTTGRRAGAPVALQDVPVRVTSNSKTGSYYPGIWLWYQDGTGWVDNPDGSAVWVYPADGGVLQTGRYYLAHPSGDKASDGVPLFVAWPDEALPTTAPTLANGQASIYYDPTTGAAKLLFVSVDSGGTSHTTTLNLDGSTVGGTGTLGSAFYADGSDGPITFADDNTDHVGSTHTGGAGTYVYSLTRDIFCSDLTVAATVTLRPGGFRIFATGTLTNSGTISAAGGDGASGTAGAGGAGGTAGLQTGSASYSASGSGTTGNAGGAGGHNGAGVAGNPTAGATAGYGSAGGAGGTASSSGGNGGVAQTAPLALNGSIHSLPRALEPNAQASGQWRLAGGAGGGGGSNSTTSSGGGGGGGGGAVFLAAKVLTNNGTITAAGGKGGNGGGSANNAGGGGGGSGGLVVLVYSGLTAGTITVAKGLKGTGFGTGADGSDGNDGTRIDLVNQ